VPRHSSRFAAACLTALCYSALAPRANGQVTTERGASILIFPRVAADAIADTMVQLANLSDNRVAASCSYVDGASPTWQALDFTVTLAPRRSWSWPAARGRSETRPRSGAHSSAFKSTAPAIHSAATSSPARPR
jgi:hypothetical protein